MELEISKLSILALVAKNIVYIINITENPRFNFSTFNGKILNNRSLR